MIPDWPSTIAAFLVTAVVLTAIGYPLARAAAPKGVPALGMAPALGWAVYTVAALPCLNWAGFSRLQIGVFSAVLLAMAALVRRWIRPLEPTARLPSWSVCLAAILAVLPAMAIMPKRGPAGILLGPPMFDHVKIAVVDAILRDGLPVSNPFYGPDAPGHLAYYYLWHVGTAALASALHIGAWGAEAAMTGFTAFASLLLMMAVTVALGGRALAVASTAVLALPGSMRPVLAALAGVAGANRVIPQSADPGAWLYQAAWVPQHLAAACCVVLAALLMVRLAEAPGWPTPGWPTPGWLTPGWLTPGWLIAALLGACVAAGFESSVWIGGVGFAVAGSALALVLAWQLPRPWHPRYLAQLAGSAALAIALISPLVLAELHAARLRDAGVGIAVMPYDAIGSLVPAGWRKLAAIPAYWLVLLPFELPAVLPLGAAWAWMRTRSGSGCHRPGSLSGALAVFGIAYLAVGWLARSTIDNNDLGWRAMLPAILLLAAFAGCSLERLFAGGRRGILAGAIAVALLGVPDTVRTLQEYYVGQQPGDAHGFAKSEALWQAVRRHAGPDDRIANNPNFVAQATPWPVNISWATLSGRPSCFAGWATVIAYGSLPREQLIETSTRFLRIFAGHARQGDVAELARRDNCAVAVVSREDGAWMNDPFATSGIYAAMESGKDWRIYERTQK